MTTQGTPGASEDASEPPERHAEEATVAVPYPHREYICPDCERSIPHEQQQRFAKPAAFEDQLLSVLKCPFCKCIFSPRPSERSVVRIPIMGDVDVEEIGRIVETTRHTVPYPRRTYQCPECLKDIPTRAQIRLAKPAQHEHELADVMKCPYCNFIFAPKPMTATVLRG